MPDLGNVRLTQQGIGAVTVFQPNQTTVVSPKFNPTPDIALDDISDVTTEGVQDGFSLVYSSANNRYEMRIANTVIELLDGGTF